MHAYELIQLLVYMYELIIYILSAKSTLQFIVIFEPCS